MHLKLAKNDIGYQTMQKFMLIPKFIDMGSKKSFEKNYMPKNPIKNNPIFQQCIDSYLRRDS
jgi:hypothetical protein